MPRGERSNQLSFFLRLFASELGTYQRSPAEETETFVQHFYFTRDHDL